MWSRFETRVPGKWVLAGEHSVLSGGTAIALPHPEFGLNLSFEPGSGDGVTVTPGDAQTIIQELLHSIEDAWQNEGRNFPRPRGRLSLDSSIPIGAGLGSSAALCVALTRWMSEPLSFGREEWFEFATQLEHRFHGRSSGMDVAVILAGEPISFVMGRGPKPLGVKKLPKFTFHDTGIRTRTSECVVRVETFREENRHLALQVDEAMSQASRNAMEGLFRYDVGDTRVGLDLIARGMLQAQECFYTWQLVPGAAKRLQEDLMRQGALAAKITGAGGGGMIVALWGDGVTPLRSKS